MHLASELICSGAAKLPDQLVIALLVIALLHPGTRLQGAQGGLPCKKDGEA